MDLKISFLFTMMSFSLGLFAQNHIGVTYEKASSSPAMQWVCPEIEKYTDLLISLEDKDEKAYAQKVMWRIDLAGIPSKPNEKYIVTQACMTIENPMFEVENLLLHIAKWMKQDKKWTKPETDVSNKRIVIHATYLRTYHASICPTLIIYLDDSGNKLFVEFWADGYTIKDAGTSSHYTYKYKVTEVFPFVADSKYKNTCARAFVNTYKYFWSFIYDLRQELNRNFNRDQAMITQLHDQEAKQTAEICYQHSNDSLRAKYGELTKMIASQTTSHDIHSEIRFYEDAQKLVFMGKTINFKDIVSCEIVDDPQFIPGKTTTYGGGLCFFGFMVGGKETQTSAGKTIHNYVVDVEIDNLKTPFIRIATGSDEYKAKEISKSFEYILRHQQTSRKATQRSNANRKVKR